MLETFRHVGPQSLQINQETLLHMSLAAFDGTSRCEDFKTEKAGRFSNKMAKLATLVRMSVTVTDDVAVS